MINIDVVTKVTYSAVGSQRTYAFPMDYLRKSFITVTLAGTKLTYGVDYTVTNKEVTLSTAPTSGSLIIISRETATDRLVSWQDASVLVAANMTVTEVQQLHILEEQKVMLTEYSIHKTADGTSWEAAGIRINNVAEPINDNDVATKVYVLKEGKKVTDIVAASIDTVKELEQKAADSTLKCEQLTGTIDKATANITDVVDAINAGRIKRAFKVADWLPNGNKVQLAITLTGTMGAVTCFGVYKEIGENTYEGVLCTIISTDKTVTLEADSAFDGFALIGSELSIDSTGVVYKPVEVTLSDTKVTEQDGVVTAVLSRN